MGGLMVRLAWWLETGVNILLTLIIFALPPFLVWREGGHWGIFVVTAFISMIAAAFISERFIVKLAWAEWLFPGLREYKAVGIDTPHKKTAEYRRRETHARPPAPGKARSAKGPRNLGRLKGQGWRIGILIFGLFLVTGGVMSLVILEKGLSNHSWLPTSGVITQSDTRFEMGEYDPGHYEPDIKYDYSVEGTAYTGYFISLGKLDMYFTEKGAMKRASEYPVGMEVTVYYYPGDPSWAVLEKGTGLLMVLLLIGGILLLRFGASAIWGALTEKSSPKGEPV